MTAPYLAASAQSQKNLIKNTGTSPVKNARMSNVELLVMLYCSNTGIIKGTYLHCTAQKILTYLLLHSCHPDQSTDNFQHPKGFSNTPVNTLPKKPLFCHPHRCGREGNNIDRLPPTRTWTREPVTLRCLGQRSTN